MVSRFVVLTDSSTVDNDARNAITAYLKGKGWQVWHWFGDVWLVDAAPNRIDLNALRLEMTSVMPIIRHLIVMSVEGELALSGIVPAEAIPWINLHWGRRKV
jgi:hypothetical protein